MYRSHNKKIRIENRGAWYELFLIAENAQHMVDRAAHPSHCVSLNEIMELARVAYYIRRTLFSRPEPHHLVYGLLSFEGK